MLEDLIKFRDSSKIFSILHEKHGDSRFVGGCVRNIMCGLEVNDVDIATTLRPEEVESAFKSHNIKTIDIGKDHGTIIAVFNSFSYEITTLRKDIHTDGRRAVVEYSSDWLEDASRRDFTINAMSYCPKGKKLYDYFGGVEDLKNGIIKFVGNPEDRVKEDYLRILRFFRFYAYCGNSSNLHRASLKACVDYAHCIKKLSAERKFHETTKILEHENASDTIIAMLQNGILDNLFETSISSSIHEILLKIDEICKSESVLVNPFLRLVAVIEKSNIEISNADKIFHLPNEIKKYLNTILYFSSKGILYIKTNLYKYVYEEHAYLMDSIVYSFAKDSIKDAAFMKEANKLLRTKKIFPVSGEDIMKALKVEQGKEVGKFLSLGRDFWYKSKYLANKNQILEYIINLK